MFRYWKIVHLGNGRHVVRSMVDPTYVLSINDSGGVCIRKEDTSGINSNDLWYIEQGQYGREFVPVSNPSTYLGATTVITDVGYSKRNIGLVTSDDFVEHRTWLPYKVSICGVWFRELKSGDIKFVDSFSRTAEVCNSFIDLDDLGHELYTYSSNDIELTSLTWQSNHPDALWISSGAGFMRSISIGTFTLTASAVFSNGTSISRSFTLTVTGLTNTTYYIQNSRTNLYMGLVSEYNATNNRQIRQKEANELSTPRWMVCHVSEGYYAIHVLLNDTQYVMKAEENSIVLTPYPSGGSFGDSMLFRFELIRDNEYSILSKSGEAANLAVTANVTASENGDGVALQPHSETNDYQHWRLLAPTAYYLGNDIYTVETEIQYDYGYLTRVGNGNAVDRLKDHILKTQHFYLLNFGVYFKFILKQSVEASYADTYCPGKVVSGSNITWNMTKCVGCDDSTVKHHGDTESIYYNMTTTKEVTVMFTGHDLCTTGEEHYDNISGEWWSKYDCSVVEYDAQMQSELSTFIHELGHILDAPDHYGELGNYSTYQMNLNEDNPGHIAYIPNLPGDRDPYNEYCIYGKDDTADTALAVCDGCIYKIRNYVTELLQGKAKIGD